MMQTPSVDAKKWGRNQFAILLKSLQEAQVQPTPPAPEITELLSIILPPQAGIIYPHRTEGEKK